MEDFVTWKIPQSLFDSLVNQFEVVTPQPQKEKEKGASRDVDLEKSIARRKCIKVGGIFYCQQLIAGQWVVIAQSQFGCPC